MIKVVTTIEGISKETADDKQRFGTFLCGNEFRLPNLGVFHKLYRKTCSHVSNNFYIYIQKDRYDYTAITKFNFMEKSII